jgi:hypothetical protein
MLQRWQRWLERSAKGWHPVMAPWHSLADVPADQFAARLAELLAGWQKPADATRRVNPILLRALAATPPRSREELAALYNRVLNAAQPGTADSDELRAVFDGPDAAPNPPPHAISELELLPDRPAQGELQKLRKPVEEWRATGPGAPPRAMVLEDLPEPYNPRVFLRGNPGNPGEAVPRQFLAVLAGPGRKPFADGSGRLELAKAIASPDNPLTARVFVNRVWMHLFGEGLVRTPGDFGLRGEPPTHPELLDHFAAGFVRDGWSVKRLIRRIVLSAAYRQSSADRADARKADPENRLLARQNRRRLDWEATRDTLLAVSGRLDRSVGGPPAGDALSTTRRTLYARLDRLNVPGLYRAFDFPSPDATSPRRDSTTTAPQALFLMNHAFPAECGKHLLSRPDLKEAAEPAIRSARIFRAVLARPATPAEARLAAGFLGEKPDAAAWERFTHALLLSNELVFVE